MRYRWKQKKTSYCAWIVLSVLSWISLAWSLSTTITLRVTFPIQYSDLLIKSLSQDDIVYQNITPTVLQFDYPTVSDEHDKFWLHRLPVSKLSIVLSEAKDDPLALIEYDNSQMEAVIHTGRQLGNTLPVEQGAETSFSISVGGGKSKRGRHNDTTKIDKSLVKRLADNFIDQHGWTKSTDKYPILSFQISTQSVGLDIVNYSLELMALVRVYPLPSPFKSNLRRRPKRLESFFVAKSANIQPNDVVWDPFCQRATILIEAAKYWPLAHYYGMDVNLPNLEHAQMNADSTMTRLCLILQNNSGGDTSGMPIPTGDETVDKIVTCLPFGKSRQWYHQRIKEWSLALKMGGKMLLVIDQPSVPSLLNAIPEAMVVEFQRNPTFLWGAQRATLLIVSKTSRHSNPPDTKVGMMEWERNGCDKEVWAATREGTIPQLVTFSRTNEHWTNRIVSELQFRQR